MHVNYLHFWCTLVLLCNCFALCVANLRFAQKICTAHANLLAPTGHLHSFALKEDLQRTYVHPKCTQSARVCLQLVLTAGAYSWCLQHQDLHKIFTVHGASTNVLAQALTKANRQFTLRVRFIFVRYAATLKQILR